MGKRLLFVLIGVLVLLALTSTVAWAQADGDTSAADGEPQAMDVLLTALAPVIAIATAIERVMEMFWSRWEKKDVWPNKGGVPDTKAPSYIGKKQVSSHWLGTLFAVVAIGLTNARFFGQLGLDVLFSQYVLFDLTIGGIFDQFTIGTLVDWVLTAVVIGWGGTELTHSVVEGLVKGRNLWKEMKEVEAGRKSVLDAEFFGDYIAPKLEERGISMDMLRQMFTTLDSVGVSPDKFISSMTTRKVDGLLTELEAQEGTAEAGRAVRALLEGVPEEKRPEVPNILALLTPEQQQRFLVAEGS